MNEYVIILYLSELLGCSNECHEREMGSKCFHAYIRRGTPEPVIVPMGFGAPQAHSFYGTLSPPELVNIESRGVLTLFGAIPY